MTKWLILASALALSACSEVAPPDPAPAEDAGSAVLELGTGSWRFEPIEDGQEVELVHGAQGGWHMWISLRVMGAEVDHPKVQLTLQPADEHLPLQAANVELAFDPPDEHGARKVIGYTGVVNDPACWIGALVRVQASVTTDDGTLLRDEHDVMLRGGVYPPPPCTSH